MWIHILKCYVGSFQEHMNSADRMTSEKTVFDHQGKQEAVFDHQGEQDAVFDHQGKPAAAVSITGAAMRVTPDRIEHFGSLVKTCAASISSQLGFNPANYSQML